MTASIKMPLTSNRYFTSTKNKILDALPKEEFQRLLPFLEFVSLHRDELIYCQDKSIRHVYFPTEGIISVTSMTKGGKTVEIGTLGKESMTGIDVILGAAETPHESTVRIPGAAYRTSADVIKREFDQGGTLQRLLLGYVSAFLVQIGQTLVCNGSHTVEQRLAGKILTCRDHMESDCLELTQTAISIMTGIARPYITIAAVKFQDAGLIAYTRGKINILNAQGLEDKACECYQKIKSKYDGFPK